MHNFYGNNIFYTLRIYTKYRKLFNEWIKIVDAIFFTCIPVDYLVHMMEFTHAALEITAYFSWTQIHGLLKQQWGTTTELLEWREIPVNDVEKLAFIVGGNAK